MAKLTCQGATLKCSFGALPAILTVTPKNPPVLIQGALAATIMDHAPIVNIPSFGMCAAPTNPAVIAATAAALGVFTPAPCVPVTTNPWFPGSQTILIANQISLNSTSLCMCKWLGAISITFPGQLFIDIP
jgi:hypothetical protein